MRCELNEFKNAAHSNGSAGGGGRCRATDELDRRDTLFDRPGAPVGALFSRGLLMRDPNATRHVGNVPDLGAFHHGRQRTTLTARA